jgi:hypothetical protein
MVAAQGIPDDIGGDDGDIILPWPAKVLNPNQRVHWAVKAKASKKAREDAFYLTKEASPRIDKARKIHVWWYFYPPDRRKRDDDNCLSACKAYRDGIAEALGVNDSQFQSHPVLMTEVIKGGRVIVRLVQL